jgi:2,5-diamino-6-(ribosylamino)-4(3H)-pyrimidinone 5'-phosphate reductase
MDQDNQPRFSPSAKRTNTSRLIVHVNVAMSVDGKIDSSERKGASISSEADKNRADELRASVDAILVGGRTLLDEDPKLTIKSEKLRSERIRKGWTENPIKVGVVTEIPSLPGKDSNKTGVNVLSTSLLNDFLYSGPARRLIYTTRSSSSDEIDRIRKTGTEVFIGEGKRVDLVAVLGSLQDMEVKRLMVEGGGTVIAEFFRLGLVDELTVYIAPKILGGASSPSLADGPGFFADKAPILELVSVGKFDQEGGILLHYRVKR